MDYFEGKSVNIFSAQQRRLSDLNPEREHCLYQDYALLKHSNPCLAQPTCTP